MDPETQMLVQEMQEAETKWAAANAPALDMIRAQIARGVFVPQIVMSEPYAYGYTVGLTPRLGYELFIMGMTPQEMFVHLLDIGTKLLDGRIEDGELVEFVEDRPGTFQFKLKTLDVVGRGPAIAPHVRLHLVGLMGLHPDAVRQIVYHDGQKAFPGDRNCLVEEQQEPTMLRPVTLASLGQARMH